jgi:hypothetical protein
MIILEGVFTVSFQQVESGLFSLAGLVNEDGEMEGKKVKLLYMDDAGIMKELTEAVVDEFHYFEMHFSSIDFLEKETTSFYVQLAGTELTEKIQLS